MENQKTFFAIKPGYAENPQIVNEICHHLQSNGCKILSKTKVQYTLEHAMDHYSVIDAKYQVPAATYLSSAPILALILEDDRPLNMRSTDFISHVRSLQGGTRCLDPNTIRYNIVNDPKFSKAVTEIRAKHMNKEIGIDETSTNVVHASDNVENFLRETKILQLAIDQNK